MNIALVSAFRNAERYLIGYFTQAEQLSNQLMRRGDRLSFVWGEGDSADDTLRILCNMRPAFMSSVRNAVIVNVTHGGPVFGPVVHPQRFRQLAHVGNRLWSAIPANADVVVLVESDLIWEAETLVKLIDDLKEVPCVAPLVMEQSTGGFYDTWAYRRNGQRFTKQAPYHPGIGEGLLQLDSAGSCLAMNAALARQLVWREEDVIVGICEQINQLGGSVWLDPTLTIFHP